MKTCSMAACFLAGLTWAVAAQAADPSVRDLSASLFKQFDKDRNKSLNEAELKGAVNKWTSYVRGKLGGDNLKAVEERLSQLNPDGDGNAAVTPGEFLEFAAGSLGIPVPPPPGALPAQPLPPVAAGGGKDKDKKDSGDKKDKKKDDDKDRRPQGNYGPSQPRFMPQQRDDRFRGGTDKSRGSDKGSSRGSFGGNSGGGNPDRRATPGSGNSDRRSTGGNSRSATRK
jgi:hypothetical protein